MSNSPDLHLSDERLHAYLDGELKSQERSEMMAHLEDCEDCAARLEAWSELFLAIEKLPDLELVKDLEPLVVAHLGGMRSRRHWTTWLLAGQGALTIFLMAYGWGTLSTWLSLGQIADWLALPILTLRTLIDSVLPDIVFAFNQYFTWSPSSADLIGRIPRLADSGTLVIYPVLTMLLLWIVGNHYLLGMNGQAEDVRTSSSG